jgi:hypothetical protein
MEKSSRAMRSKLSSPRDREFLLLQYQLTVTAHENMRIAFRSAFLALIFGILVIDISTPYKSIGLSLLGGAVGLIWTLEDRRRQRIAVRIQEILVRAVSTISDVESTMDPYIRARYESSLSWLSSVPNSEPLIWTTLFIITLASTRWLSHH